MSDLRLSMEATEVLDPLRRPPWTTSQEAQEAPPMLALAQRRAQGPPEQAAQEVPVAVEAAARRARPTGSQEAPERITVAEVEEADQWQVAALALQATAEQAVQPLAS